MNAAEELLEELLDFIKKKPTDIKCIRIRYVEYLDREWYKGQTRAFHKDIKLKVGFTEQELQQLWNDLDFEYDNGYGGQELFGIVWFNDGSWLERWEYGGLEGWAHKTAPKIPDNLNQI